MFFIAFNWGKTQRILSWSIIQFISWIEATLGHGE